MFIYKRTHLYGSKFSYFSAPEMAGQYSWARQASSKPARLLLLLTLFPLSLAFYSFLLQWHGDFIDPIPLPLPDPLGFPGSGNDVLSRVSRFPGSDCVDPLRRTHSPSFPYYRDWKFDYVSDLEPKICFTTSTSADLEQILPWIFYHKVIGVSTFFLFVEGKAASPDVSKVLATIPGVKVIYRTKELEEQQAKSRIWNESWLAGFFYKPCNYELFVKQNLNMEMGIVMARDAGMDWIFHLDTDELMYPVGSSQGYSLGQVLKDLPENVDMVVFPNYETCVERDDIREPFSEVSLFKKNYDHLPKEVYFSKYKEATRGNPNYFLTYGNGKSGARINDHLRPNGAHRWHNYMKAPVEVKMEEAAVLHYTYPKFSDLTSRRDRCGCKPTKEDVKRCFMLEFDRAVIEHLLYKYEITLGFLIAFIIASTATEEEMFHWYREHVVWTDKNLTRMLLKKGILTRITAPMVIIQSLKESGIFSSVISADTQSAQTKERFLDIVESSNDSSVHAFGKIYLDNNTKSSDFHEKSRRVLEIRDQFSHSSAIPPLSPPSLLDEWKVDD